MIESQSKQKLTVEELVARITAGVTATILKEVNAKIEAMSKEISELRNSQGGEVVSSAPSKAWVAGYVKEVVAERLPVEWVTKSWVEDAIKASVGATNASDTVDIATRTWVSGFVAQQVASRVPNGAATQDWVKQYVDDRLRETVTQQTSSAPATDWHSSATALETLARPRLSEQLVGVGSENGRD